jgi:hypothetical protein
MAEFLQKEPAYAEYMRVFIVFENFFLESMPELYVITKQAFLVSGAEAPPYLWYPVQMSQSF